MTDSDEAGDGRRIARELLRFLDEVMRAIARVELGDPGVARLTLLELRLLTALAEAGDPMSIIQLSDLTEAGVGEPGQAPHPPRELGRAERAGGGRGWERAFLVAHRGQRLLNSMEGGRQAAIERFIAGLGRSERLRLQGAAHLLGRDLDRLSGGMLTA